MLDYKRILFENALANRIPLTVTMEIIAECNFRCLHCYIDENIRKQYISYEDVKKFVDQIVRQGCLYITLTGGEVMLHPDFIDIYMYLVKKGCCVTVLTNGSMLTEKICSLFEKYPPRRIEVTLYGFSEDTYQTVTKTRMFERVKRNILRLKEQGTRLLLKMFVVQENYCDFIKIAEFADCCNIPFKYDSTILASSNSQEMKHQIDTEKAILLEKQSSVAHNDFDELWVQYSSRILRGKLFQCGAGRSTCWLKSDYQLKMCNFLKTPSFSMYKHTFSDAWKEFSKVTAEVEKTGSSCSMCKMRDFCDACPAKLAMFYGDLDKVQCYEQFRCIAEWRMSQESLRGGAE